MARFALCQWIGAHLAFWRAARPQGWKIDRALECCSAPFLSTHSHYCASKPFFPFHTHLFTCSLLCNGHLNSLVHPPFFSRGEEVDERDSKNVLFFLCLRRRRRRRLIRNEWNLKLFPLPMCGVLSLACGLFLGDEGNKSLQLFSSLNQRQFIVICFAQLPFRFSLETNGAASTATGCPANNRN